MDGASIQLVLALLLALQAKHFLCDGPLQSRAMIAAKGNYGAALGLAHAGMHGLGSLLVLWGFGLGIGWATGLAAAEALVHYHLDHGKERLVKAMGWTPRQTQFWWALGLDQALHQASYLAIAAAFAALA
jgi:hypothetical protein